MGMEELGGGQDESSLLSSETIIFMPDEYRKMKKQTLEMSISYTTLTDN